MLYIKTLEKIFKSQDNVLTWCLNRYSLQRKNNKDFGNEHQLFNLLIFNVRYLNEFLIHSKNTHVSMMYSETTSYTAILNIRKNRCQTLLLKKQMQVF